MPFVFLFLSKASTKESPANHDARSDSRKNNKKQKPKDGFLIDLQNDVDLHFLHGAEDMSQSKKAEAWKGLPEASRRQSNFP